MTPRVRVPAATSLSSRASSAALSHVRVKKRKSKGVFRRERISSAISRSCITQQKSALSNCPLARKFSNTAPMLASTISFVAAFTVKGRMFQTSSPSKKTFAGSLFCRRRHTAVFPAPIVPLMKISLVINPVYHARHAKASGNARVGAKGHCVGALCEAEGRRAKRKGGASVRLTAGQRANTT